MLQFYWRKRKTITENSGGNHGINRGPKAWFRQYNGNWDSEKAMP